MQGKINWLDARDEVRARFAALCGDTDAIAEAMRFLDAWFCEPVFAPQREPVWAHIVHEQYAVLLDSFYQLVPFGTGGRRARVGYGPNRINPITVAMSVQGHCAYLEENYPSHPRRVVIAFDTRRFTDISQTYAFLSPPSTLLGLTSRALAQIASEVYAGNGFEVYTAGLDPETEYLSTPELSFAVRHLGASAGMNVSASHNFPDDNGFKFFNEHGAQDVPPTDQLMASYMGGVHEIQRAPYSEAVAGGLIRPLPAELHAAYLRANLALRSKAPLPLTVVYTPLCGTGDATVGDVLRAAGYDVRVYGPQATYDGSFSAIPFRLPNPEVPEAASPALETASSVQAELVLCSDPDADRLGVFARDRAGQWQYLNGNEIASILAYYLAADQKLGPRRSGFLIKTLVTTRMLERIAERSGCAIIADLLVGFKYIAQVLVCLEREGRYGGFQARPDSLVMAGEESHGILLTPEIRDKDAAGAALMLCELVAQLHSAGQYLTDYLDALALECGNYQSVTRSLVMRGISGASRLADMMRSIRETPPEQFAGLEVSARRDLLAPEFGPLRSETERLSRNLLVYDLAPARIAIRPSGTEPKIKIYVDVEGAKLPGANDREAAARFARKLGAAAVEELLRRIGLRLSASASLLPDYIELDLKAGFDSRFRPALLAVTAQMAGWTDSERIRWLRDQLEPYSPGSDALRATADALQELLHELASDVSDPATARSLAALRETLAGATAPAEWVRPAEQTVSQATDPS